MNSTELHSGKLEGKSALDLLQQASLRMSKNESAHDEIGALSNLDAGEVLAASERISKNADAAVATVLEAIAERIADKETRKAIRKILFRLRAQGIQPLKVQNEQSQIKQAEPSIELKGCLVSQTRDQGEVRLIVSWEVDGSERLRQAAILDMDFWENGLKDCTITEPMTQRSFERDVIQFYKNSDIHYIECGTEMIWELLQEALGVNEWRKEALPTMFVQRRAMLEALLQENIKEAEPVALIMPGMEPEDVVVNWLGAWALGDYGLAYDLLAEKHPVKKGIQRSEFIQSRRDWAAEAAPHDFLLTLAWEPKSEKDLTKKVEAFWSFCQDASPLGGTFPEMPLGTSVNTFSNRYWYWTSYFLEQNVTGEWLIVSQQDDGLDAQRLGKEELEKLIQQHKDQAQRAAGKHLPEEDMEVLQEVTGLLTASLHYLDVLIVKEPKTMDNYEDAAQVAAALFSFERSMAYYQKMLAAFPDNAEAQMRIGRFAYLTGLQEVEREQEDAAFWFEGSRRAMEAAVELQPQSEAYQILGELDLREKRFKDSLINFKQAIDLNSESASLWMSLGHVEIQANLYEAAVEAYSRAVEFDPDLPMVHYHLALAYTYLNRLDEARDTYEEAIRREPENSQAMNNLANVLVLQGQLGKARSLLERAISLEPENALYLANLANIFAAIGSKRKALEVLAQAEKIDPRLQRVKDVRKIIHSI